MALIPNETAQAEIKRLVHTLGRVLAPDGRPPERIRAVASLMNAGGALGKHRVSERTVYSYWYARADDDVKDVGSRHMDRARDLVRMRFAANDNRLPCLSEVRAA
jgi:hypothetical protein